MGRVRPLPPSLVSKIAAGEVVERPASVVKELVENSLDAGACQVEVELEDGGLRLVRVVDDGEGMEEEDALLALEEYSTSKIATIQDLSCITTLGFRGEALHAIAAVSRFTLFTSPGGLGTVVKVEGGVLKSVSKKPRSRGTTVEVRDLFFNLRARRRFLRSSATERSHILQVMKEYILAYPKVRFLLRERGEVLLEALLGDLKERAAALWGLKPKDILSLEAQDGSMRLEGVLAAPHFTRRDARGEFFFVNGRPVKDRLLAGALMEGMRTRLVKGEYP
ncbi:MAG: DNA mismatch repair endonuclease MutL, partial [Aquificota bacterium]